MSTHKWIKIKKNSDTPVNPSFAIFKEFKGGILYMDMFS